MSSIEGRKFSKETVSRFEAEAIPHFPALKRFANQLMRNQTEAEDLVQETVMQAYQSFHQYESNTNCRAWLYKIMHNKYFHISRTNSRFLTFENEDKVFQSLVVKATVLEDLSDQSIINSLNFIPEKFRRVLILSDFHEFTYREIADKLHIPMGTVMSRLHRGRKILAEQFHRNQFPQCPHQRMFNSCRFWK